MEGDVKLDQFYSNWVTIEGDVLSARTADFILDSPARRGSGGGANRRALVHDQKDGLTLNFNQDYPGGITLNGVSYISPKSQRVGPSGRFVSTRTVSELEIDGGIEFVWDNGPTAEIRGRVSHEKVSLQSLIVDLQQQVADLTQRATVFEGK